MSSNEQQRAARASKPNARGAPRCCACGRVCSKTTPRVVLWSAVGAHLDVARVRCGDCEYLHQMGRLSSQEPPG